MLKLTIDEKHVEIEEGATILDAARKIGVEIPTLCHLPGRPAQTSCYLCVVRVNGGPRLVPACATMVTDGMTVESETESVRDARRTAIELLLSDHLGDCIGPCQGVCPAHMDIPDMIRHIAAGRFREGLVTVKERIALPAILGRICPELCEKGCRRAAKDGPVSVCRLKRFVADADLAFGDPYLPPCKPDTGKRVAIVGAGPAGLAAAYYLRQEGHACALYDDREKPGGMLRFGVSPEVLPHDVLDAEIGIIAKMGAEFRMGVRIGRDVSLDALREDHDAALLAVGEVTKEAAQAFGLSMAGPGIRTDKRTMMTALPGVFAAGSVITPSHHAVRAVADGRTAAASICQYLAGEPIAPHEKEWSVHVGRLDAEEVVPFAKIASPLGRQTPAGGHATGFAAAEARREALRCLHCDCRGAENCKLRRFAIEYDANPTRFKGERREFTQDATHPTVLFESGKCIACGICVRIAAERKEELGLTFIGRGFTVRAAAPFGAELADALRQAAQACAEACPTGALVLKEEA
jgi:ferredoxin